MELATRFGYGSTKYSQQQPLTNDQMFRFAPSIFANDKHESRSSKYTYIPTINVLDGLRREGFQPFQVVQSRSRIEGKSEFTKHMIRLRKADQIVADEANEIILVNSHDGTSSYQMLAGVFRFVCQNGMVCGDTVQDIRVAHRGNVIDNVIDAAYTILDQFDIVDQSLETMKQIQLTKPEQKLLAEAAISLKYDDEDKQPIDSTRLLAPKRWEDNNRNDLWTNFNVIQENLIRGGQRGVSSNGRRVTTRPVQSIDNNVKLNKALWMLADGMAKLKA